MATAFPGRTNRQLRRHSFHTKSQQRRGTVAATETRRTASYVDTHRRWPGPDSGLVLDCNLLAVYGTLRRRSIFDKLPIAISRLQFVSSGLLSGRLLWQRTYPALIRGGGIVEVEIFRVVDSGVWRHLDLYEGFEPINPPASLFIRRQVLLLNPQVRVWVYFLNPQIPRGIQQRSAPALGAAYAASSGWRQSRSRNLP